MAVHQTSGAEVPGSNPASPTGSLCNNVKKTQGREGNLPLRQKNDLNSRGPHKTFFEDVFDSFCTYTDILITVQFSRLSTAKIYNFISVLINIKR